MYALLPTLSTGPGGHPLPFHARADPVLWRFSQPTATMPDETPDNTPATPADFEASLEALETLVARMESGELGLERSLEEFQQGMQLVDRCQKALDEAQRRMESLTAGTSEATAPTSGETDRAGTGNVPGDDDAAPF